MSHGGDPERERSRPPNGTSGAPHGVRHRLPRPSRHGRSAACRLGRVGHLLRSVRGSDPRRDRRGRVRPRPAEVVRVLDPVAQRAVLLREHATAPPAHGASGVAGAALLARDGPSADPRVEIGRRDGTGPGEHFIEARVVARAVQGSAEPRRARGDLPFTGFGRESGVPGNGDFVPVVAELRERRLTDRG